MAEDGKHWSTEYVPVSGESRVISENTWNTLTGENIDVLPGTYMCITNTEETSLSISSRNSFFMDFERLSLKSST